MRTEALGMEFDIGWMDVLGVALVLGSLVLALLAIGRTA